MSAHVHEAVGGPIWTRPFKALIGIFALGAILILWRLLAGLGATTGLNDGYPWGLWIAFDVVTGTALGCGGYAVAILVYVLNRGRYHPMVRSAILTSALGYSMAAVAIVIDVGRYWYIWRIPTAVTKWNLDSALLEVALCVMAYVVVLWIELSPAFFENWRDSRWPLLRKVSSVASPILDKVLIWIVALGLLLPTMHQSSLGTVMVLAGHKVHPLWQTPLLPLLFLVSCIGMGYAIVVVESLLSSAFLRRKRETEMLASLSVAASVTLFLYLALRLADVAYRGRLGLIFAFDRYGLLFLVEFLLFLVPALLLLSPRLRRDAGWLFRSAGLVLLAGTLYRFDVYLIAFDPGKGWSYFPAVPEVFVTVGIVALEVLAYVILVKNFPILSGHVAADSKA
jgi:Ni/Fe-hydrogenase subunit HybB-like protein